MKDNRNDCDGCPSCTRVRMLAELLDSVESETEEN